MDEKPKRWRFRFKLRTLLIAMAILMLPMAWVGYSLNWIRQRQRFPNREFLDSIAQDREDIVGIRRPVAPSWLWLFGEAGVDRIGIMRPDSSLDIDYVRHLFPEATIDELSIIEKREGGVPVLYQPVILQHFEPLCGSK